MQIRSGNLEFQPENPSGTSACYFLAVSAATDAVIVDVLSCHWRSEVRMRSASCHSGRMQPPARLRPPPSTQGINPGVGKNSPISPRCSSNKHSLDLVCFTGGNQLEGFGGTGENKGTAISNGAPSHRLAQLQEVSGRLRQL